MMSNNTALRTHLAKALDWHDAHADFDTVVKGLSPELQGKRPAGMPYSPWKLLEHLRLTQFDILDFCRNPKYAEREWPKEYWPESDAPSSPKAWDESVRQFRRDCDALKQLANDESIDLFAKIPHGSGQTYLRELLLILDHNAHHLGELIAVRRVLGAWPPK